MNQTEAAEPQMPMESPMKPDQVKTKADAKKIVVQRGLDHVKVGVTDIDGVAHQIARPGRSGVRAARR